MNMKLSKSAVSKAKKDGADVTTIRKVQKPAPPKLEAAAAPPVTANISTLEASNAELKQSIKMLEISSESRIQELLGVIETLSMEKPVRCKVHRDMDRKSDTYLLMEYFDVIPVSFTRKLHS